VKRSCSALGLSEKSDKDQLEERITKSGVANLLDKVDEPLLKAYCETLSLEAAPVEDMKKQVADEVMLTGMESLLNKLPESLLTAHAREMGLPSEGNQKELVERFVLI